MTPAQATLGAYAENTERWPPVGRDEWGPTSRRPLPIPEAERTVVRSRIERYGFNLDCIREADGWLRVHVERGYHPDDEHREDHYPDDEEAAVAADLARVNPHHP